MPSRVRGGVTRVLGDLLTILTAFVVPPAATAAAQAASGHRWPDRQICVRWCCTAALLALCDLVAGIWTASVAATASAALAVLWYWWRRKGRRLLSLLMSKYQYIRDAMVRVMRERSRPRPVLRPTPGAVR
jgi:Flp pilus assembly protein TadB